MKEDNIIIPKKRYQELLDAEVKLRCLEVGGVDNWDWYDDSLEGYYEMLEEREQQSKQNHSD